MSIFRSLCPKIQQNRAVETYFLDSHGSGLSGMVIEGFEASFMRVQGMILGRQCDVPQL